MRVGSVHVGRAPVLVCGAEPLIGHVARGLQAGSRSVRVLAFEECLALSPSRIRTLVLIDPDDAAGQIRALAARLDGRRRFAPRDVRVILVHSSAGAPTLPVLGAESCLRLETFGIAERAARALLTRWPLHLGLDPLFGQVPHLLVAGFEAPAEAFLLQALRLIQYGHDRPCLTLLADDPDSLRGYWEAAYPQAGQVADLAFGSLADPVLADRPAVTLVLVSVAPARGLAIALDLARSIARVQRVSPPILLEVGTDEPGAGVELWGGQVLPSSYLREACRPSVLLDGIGDEVAQTIHEHYCDSIAAQGRDPATEPAGQPWSRLATSYREANRHQADHLWAKLAVTDCTAVAEDMVESFAFDPLEVERLASIEHRRWAADRHLDGWRYAPVRDNQLKHHPQLIPYDDLSEPMKDLDRFAVRGVPTLLARSGLGVLRLLILAIPEPGANAPGGTRLRALARRVLERLVSRYPDRVLVVASTLRDAAARVLVREAIEGVGARLFWLLPSPLDELIAAQPDRIASEDLIALGAVAERRIGLDGEEELGRWLRERAEIQVQLGEQRREVGPGKRVTLARGRGPDWGFEY